MKKQEINKDSILYKALEEYNLMLVKKYDIEYEPHTYSAKTEKKILRAINYRFAWYYSLVNTAAKRVAVIIAAMIVALSTATFGIDALRNPFIDFIIETFEKYSVIYFNNDSKDKNSDNKFKAMTLGYIPEGFEITYENLTDYSYTIEYANGESKNFYFKQIDINQDPISINTEGAKTRKIKINDVKGIIIITDGAAKIVWSDDYSYILSGNLEESELIKIAESVYYNKVLQPMSLGYIPEGMRIKRKSLGHSYDIEYANSKNESFSFHQSFKDDVTTLIDTEDGITEQITINGKNGLYVYDTKQNNSIIIWSDDVYCFVVTGNIGKDELVKITKSVHSNEELTLKTLGYIPEGFKVDFRLNEEYYYKIEYSGNGSKQFDFIQTPTDDSSTLIDTEDAVTETIEINNNDALLVSKKGFDKIYWSDGVYEYRINGNLGKDELIKIAEAIY